MSATNETSTFRAPAPVPMPWRRRLEAIVRGPVQVGVWATFGLVGVWLAGQTPGGGPMRGLVRAPEAIVYTSHEGRLAEVLVREGEVVEAGAVVARLHSAMHDDLLATAQGEVDVLAAELAAAVAEEALVGLELAVAAEERRAELELSGARLTLDSSANALRGADLVSRLASEVRERRVEVAALDVQLATGRASLARLRQQEARAAGLATSGVDRRATAQDLALEVAELEAAVAGNEDLRAAALVAAEEAQRELDAADERTLTVPVALAAAPSFDVDLATAGTAAGRARVRALERALAAAEVTVERLELGRAELDLVAPIHGRVVSVLVQPGAAVTAGYATMVLRSDVPSDVVVYLDEVAVNAAPREVSLARAADPRRTARSRVVRMGAGVEELPIPLRRLPTQPEYGRAVVVELPPGLGLMPGERVRASLVSEPAAGPQP